jgi:hypothetical protein
MSRLWFALFMLAPSAADAIGACNRPVDRLPGVMPIDGAIEVPTNVVPFVRMDVDNGLGLLLSNGDALAFLVETFLVVDGSGETSFLRLLPEEDLPSGETIQIVNGDDTLSSFTTGLGRDDSPPSPPTVSFIGPYTDGPCDPSAVVDVGGDADAVLFIGLRDRPDPEGVFPVTATGASVDDELIVSGEAETEQSLYVVAVDLSGNVSSSTEVRVEFPEAPGYPPVMGLTCASQTSAPESALPWLLLLIFLVTLNAWRTTARRHLARERGRA